MLQTQEFTAPPQEQLQKMERNLDIINSLYNELEYNKYAFNKLYILYINIIFIYNK